MCENSIRRHDLNMKKYELTEQTKEVFLDEIVLRRIRALQDIPLYGVKAGDLGGWVESESNLSQYDDCWVGGDACVYGDSLVSGDALVDEGALVFEAAEVFGYARVRGGARVYGNAKVHWRAQVSGNARVREGAIVEGDSVVTENAIIEGCAFIAGHSVVKGDAIVRDHTVLPSNAIIASTHDYLIIGPMGSRKDYTTFYRAASGIWVSCGCFNGEIEKFKNRVKRTHGGNEYAKEYMDAIEFVCKRFQTT